jgi:YgiT-type zinc finger domain-containing protein
VNECGCEDCTICLSAPACVDCGTAMGDGVADEAFHRDGRVLLIRHIPAIVCGQCGTFYLDAGTIRLVEAQLERFLGRKRACDIEEFEEEHA